MQLKDLGKTGVKVAEIGMGTSGMGFGTHNSDEKSLQLGLDLGMTFIDTAESYGSEELVGQAIRNRRDVFVATKVSQNHLRYDSVLKACESSLKHLKISCIDLYQVHWPNPRIPISETMRAMENLADAGKIRFIGVSNFSVQQTKETQEALSKHELASNQVEYSLLDRTIERDLLTHCIREKITLIAYTPLAAGSIAQLRGGKAAMLDRIAAHYQKTRCQTAMNYLTSSLCVIAIPKAAKPDHVRENAGASGWRLSNDDRYQISQTSFPFPPMKRLRRWGLSAARKAYHLKI